MKMNIDVDYDFDRLASIKVVGVGGGGCNAVNRMSSSGMSSVEFIAVNTDNQSLRFSNATYKIHIGGSMDGAGNDPEKGREAAEESQDEITEALKGTNMVYITAGMGGGTGTGAAPVIAKLAHDMGILTVGVVTKPFEFEGKRRMTQAEAGIVKLRDCVDALLVIPNERLRHISDKKITLFNAFVAADEVLTQAVQSISDLINIPGVVNLDFADVCAIMKNAGNAHMGIGRASGPDKAEVAAQAAISSPLLETSINGARGVIVNFLTSPDVDLADINTASMMIHDAAHEDVNLIWGVAFDEKMEDEISIVVIATNFADDEAGKLPEAEDRAEEAAAPAQAPAEEPSQPAVETPAPEAHEADKPAEDAVPAGEQPAESYGADGLPTDPLGDFMPKNGQRPEQRIPEAERPSIDIDLGFGDTPEKAASVPDRQPEPEQPAQPARREPAPQAPAVRRAERRPERPERLDAGREDEDLDVDEIIAMLNRRMGKGEAQNANSEPFTFDK